MNQDDLDPQPISVYNTLRINKALSHPSPRPILVQPDDLSYKLISLTKGQVALVDAEDYEYLVQHYWQARWSKSTKTFYAQCMIPKSDGGQKYIAMHRAVMRITDPRVLVDHKDRNLTLDNRKRNLRIATKSQNGWNSKTPLSNTSGTKGITWHKANRKWVATITVNYKHKYLGSFATKDEAIAAHQKASRKHYGEFATS